VVPIFGFPEWKYYNLKDILYPSAFNETDFSTKKDPDILGMIGNGTMQRMMILSKPALNHGFENASGQGIPASMNSYTCWIKNMVMWMVYRKCCWKNNLPCLGSTLLPKEIEDIKEGPSDINMYGVKNKVEFFAVAAEYFLSSPVFSKHTTPSYTKL
jgi:hypothetical protein